MKYNIQSELHDALNHLKGFEVAYSGKKKNIIFMDFHGQRYALEIHEVYGFDEKDFHEAANKYFA